MKSVSLTIIALCLIVSTASAQESAVDETQKTAAAVVAVGLHWSRAESHGDTAYVAGLLLPEYLSVDAHGAAHTKADIVGFAREHGKSGARAIAVAAWLKAHPYEPSVVIHDNTAIMSYNLKALAPGKNTSSIDVLVYDGRRWHALYSQGTDAAETSSATAGAQ